jgi:hypothetical protein
MPNPPRFGIFIREHLLKMGEDYVQNMWREYKKWCLRKGYKPPTYHSFRAYFWHLKDLGLVELSRVEKSKFGIDRHYYRIKKGMENSDFWKGSLKAKSLRKRS